MANHNCEHYRAEALEKLGQGAPDCASCSAWELAQQRLASALTSLEAKPAPELLELRIASELALRDLAPLPAPAALDVRVERSATEVAAESVSERALRALDGVPAPSVLDRLVAEEINAGASARTRRFAGDLPRESAPESLTGRLRSLSDSGEPHRLRRLGAAAASVAAAVLLFLGTRPDSQPEPPQYKFKITEASSLDELSPFARGFVAMSSRGAVGPFQTENAGETRRTRRDG